MISQKNQNQAQVFRPQPYRQICREDCEGRKDHWGRGEWASAATNT